MRKLWLLLLLAPSALIYACGGDDSGTDGGSDAANDNTTKTDSPTTDGSTNDVNNLDSSTTDASDAAVAFDVTCQKPADCTGDAGANVCCADIPVNGGTPPACKIVGISTSCTTGAACPTNITAQSTCNGTDQVRACATNADCTEAQYNKCCTFKLGGDAGGDGGVSFCLNNQLAQLGGGTCQ